MSGNVFVGNAPLGGGKGGGKGASQLPAGFSAAASTAQAIGRSGMARSEIERITSGVVVPR
jgi:hypothetical protein